ncbi:MAG TPA: metallophosphoesterase [Oligoflexus sp.]|uniref:metallophosphoesterase n=1 Tax=Oligoflexus sp. TaxID=1971216 RepID=UPI002D2D7AE9|nr:metallophosphoesterase [Oligoflexus sp.]HYX38563.1 metallophosphoesterase [Oligoflexus sp.]
MRRILNPFVLILTIILAAGYSYLALRLFQSLPARLALVLPILCIWIIPVFFWSRSKDTHTGRDDFVQGLAYMCMGWLNFLLFLTLFRDIIWLLTVAFIPNTWAQWLIDPGSQIVVLGSFLALGLGMLIAWRGPRVVEVTVPIQDLDPALEGYRIAQISDLHVSFMIRRRYVQSVVNKVNTLGADMVVLTGDIVDGSVARLKSYVEPLATLQPAAHRYFILGNHEYYAGVRSWVDHFRSLGLTVLLNEYRTIHHKGSTLHLGGVVDPAGTASGEGPKPENALGPGGLRILLAHNPKLAPHAAPLGFDLMLSGHTHAGQFYPWNIAVRLVHAPHVVGLSREGKMWVYVNPGTGSWGPPIRLGTQPELTVIHLVRAKA